MNDRTGATSDFTSAIELYSRDREIYTRRGRAHQSKGNVDAGVVDFDRARKADAQLSPVYHDRSRAHALQQDSHAAAHDFAAAAKLDLNSADQAAGVGKPLVRADDR
jgi:hypothetical protein